VGQDLDASPYVGIVGGKSDPVLEATRRLRRRGARVDQQEARNSESVESVDVGCLLGPSQDDNVVVFTERYV